MIATFEKKHNHIILRYDGDSDGCIEIIRDKKDAIQLIETLKLSLLEMFITEMEAKQKEVK